MEIEENREWWGRRTQKKDSRWQRNLKRIILSYLPNVGWYRITLVDYWSRIAVTLGVEEEARKEAVRVGAALNKVKSPTTAAVYMACADLGIPGISGVTRHYT